MSQRRWEAFEVSYLNVEYGTAVDHNRLDSVTTDGVVSDVD